MALAIRLSLVGKRGQPIYRVVVGEKRSKRDGINQEIIGHFNPNVQPPHLELKKDRFNYWLKQGAQISSGMRKLLTANKL